MIENIITQPDNNLTYTIAEIAKILNISVRSAYNLCGKNAEFKVLKVGRNIRVNKNSFDKWFNDCEKVVK